MWCTSRGPAQVFCGEGGDYRATELVLLGAAIAAGANWAGPWGNGHAVWNQVPAAQRYDLEARTSPSRSAARTSRMGGTVCAVLQGAVPPRQQRDGWGKATGRSGKPRSSCFRRL